MTAAAAKARIPNACAPWVMSGGSFTNGSISTRMTSNVRMSSSRSTTMVDTVRAALTCSSLTSSTSRTSSPARPGSTLLAR